MTSGGWQDQEHRHGRHRQGAAGAAWTPAVRPTDPTPAQARRGGLPGTPGPADTAVVWPVSEVLTRRPGWPVEEPEVPAARHAHPAWRVQRGKSEAPRPDPDLRRQPVAEAAGARQVAEPPPRRKTVCADMVFATVPSDVQAPPETAVTGLRTFDLGNVPASVTPPPSWRRAAWFAVGTSAAVVLGLAVAAAELMGRPGGDGVLIDALPAYPSGPLTLDEPTATTTTAASGDAVPGTSVPGTPSEAAAPPAGRPEVVLDEPAHGTGGTTGAAGAATGEQPPGEGTPRTPPREPVRRTVGPVPLAPTDPQTIGDRTEEYFRLVTTDPAAAYAMTTGDLAREGVEGIGARYAGVERIEVQEITIDRNCAVTTSTVRIVHEGGAATVERRQLTFTWGADPRISGETITG